MSSADHTDDTDTLTAYLYPAGHLGHLSDQQRQLLSEFKTLCAERKQYTPGSSTQRPSTDDATLLRFLRARKFQLEPAYNQFVTTERWRRENQLTELYEKIDIDEYEATRRLYPQWTGRRDRRGMPVYLFDVAPLKTSAVFAYEQAKSLKRVSRIFRGFEADSTKSPIKMLRLFALYENLCRFISPWSTTIDGRPHTETPITQGNNIIDISGVGLKQFWDLKNHMQDSSQLATAHYPETLDSIFVIGAPSFFPTVWNWIKRWFDPIVVSKIHVVAAADVYTTLAKYIAPADIPKKFGGQLDFKFGDMPNIDPAMARQLTWGDGATMVAGQHTVPIGPIRWEEGENGEMVALAVGCEQGQPRRKVVATLDKKYAHIFFPSDAGTEGKSST
ncbi:CRAL-TRIO domain-containing protein [Naematelia encephala]|uniref:CRAL-TRIO domain-containing protein n=1 Tax=Naematelia encephala TaxID=71784 RepID=A0A1Y2AG45_9TREE|nr:CRAL-TRIO domain-containing protein [Naematelia encephala]